MLLLLAGARGVASETASFYCRGTAVIDGVEGPDEWANAAAATAEITMPAGLGGGTHTLTFLLMNDDANWYVAVRLPFGSSPASPGVLALSALVHRRDQAPCDPATVLDEHAHYSADGDQIYDDLHWNHLAGCTFEESVPDIAEGGTSDGGGSWGTDGSSTFFEIGFPLDSDDAHDLSVLIGERIFVEARAGVCDSSSCTVTSGWRYGFVAAEGLFFLGDFEGGDLEDWSIVVHEPLGPSAAR